MPNSKSPKCKSFGCENAPKEKAPEEAEVAKSLKEDVSLFRGVLNEIQLPSFIRNFGPQQAQKLKTYGPGWAAYAFAALVAVIYVCDWKPVVKCIPYYSGKFPVEKKRRKKKPPKAEETKSDK